MQARQATQILGGKYRLVRRLGQGGMGSVWHAEHLTLNSPVALKLIEPGTTEDPDALQRFLREARTAAALRSPHVVQILDYGVDGDTPYIAMELLEGESLAERLARLGRLTPLQTARVVQHVARAIGRAHDAGIIHRDLKPENVFIVDNDDEEVVKVLDFGIAKSTMPSAGGTSAAGATRTGALLGTPYYMSPEQAEAVKALDHRTDIWSLGVLAHKCLVGTHPFKGESLGQLILAICSHPLPVPSNNAQVPDGFDAWFARACARSASDRFDSAKQAASEFARLCDAFPASGESSLPARVASALAATTGHATNSEVRSLPPRASRSLAQRAALIVLGLLLLGVVASFALRPTQPVAPWPRAPAQGAPASATAPTEGGSVEALRAPQPASSEPSSAALPRVELTAAPSEPTRGAAAAAAVAVPAAAAATAEKASAAEPPDAKPKKRAPTSSKPRKPMNTVDLGF
jgi:serine/threonine-protein kinase